ncbi:MAG TPA: hypothetical protein V6D19_11690 [Stenomitos sp.]
MLSNYSLLRTNFKIISLNHIPLVEMPCNVQERDIINLNVIVDQLCKDNLDHIVFDYCQTASIEAKALSSLNEICERLDACCIEVIFWSLSPKIYRLIKSLNLINIISMDVDTNFVLPLKENQGKLQQFLAKALNVFRPKSLRLAK